MPLATALKLTKPDRVWFAMILARVVFPTPGGPQKIIEEILCQIFESFRLEATREAALK